MLISGAISGNLRQEQKWNARTVLRPIAYGSKVLSNTEMKYGAPKAEIFAVVTFKENYCVYMGSATFKLRLVVVISVVQNLIALKGTKYQDIIYRSIGLHFHHSPL